VSILKKFFPPLIEGYSSAVKNNLIPPEIEPEDLKKILNMLSSMKKEISSAFTFINMTLYKTDTQTVNKNIKIFSISKCIEEALERYPFDDTQRNMIVWQKDENEDFSIQGDKLLLIHVFFNLLKNSLYYIDKKRSGNIEIQLKKGFPNKVFFKDTGTGIAPDVLPHIVGNLA
jgi:two-component system CAI-1 autoinducer sensor kinase/phosphatase CqsS